MIHDCSQKEEITKLSTVVERLEKTIEGNGREGLRETVIKLTVTVNQLAETLKDMTTVQSGLLKFQMETIGEARALERKKTNFQWGVGVVIAVITAYITFLTVK